MPALDLSESISQLEKGSFNSAKEVFDFAKDVRIDDARGTVTILYSGILRTAQIPKIYSLHLKSMAKASE